MPYNLVQVGGDNPHWKVVGSGRVGVPADQEKHLQPSQDVPGWAGQDIKERDNVPYFIKHIKSIEVKLVFYLYLQGVGGTGAPTIN